MRFPNFGRQLLILSAVFPIIGMWVKNLLGFPNFSVQGLILFAYWDFCKQASKSKVSQFSENWGLAVDFVSYCSQNWNFLYFLTKLRQILGSQSLKQTFSVFQNMGFNC